MPLHASASLFNGILLCTGVQHGEKKSQRLFKKKKRGRKIVRVNCDCAREASACKRVSHVYSCFTVMFPRDESAGRPLVTEHSVVAEQGGGTCSD